MRAQNNLSRLNRETSGNCCTRLLWLLFLLAAFAAPAAPVYPITDFVVCRNANMNAPNDWHVPQAVFGTNADRFFAWVELTNVSGRHPVEMRLYRPDGTFYGKEMQPINETNGISSWWRMTAWWRVKGQPLAQTQGLWKLDLVIDGALQRSILLKIGSGNPVPNAAGPPASVSPAMRAQTTSLPASASRNSWVCVILASSDLVHWTPIGTNALPSGAVPVPTTAKARFRLQLSGPDARACLIAASTDSVNWTVIQTNVLPRPPLLDPSDTGVATARFYRATIR